MRTYYYGVDDPKPPPGQNETDLFDDGWYTRNRREGNRLVRADTTTTLLHYCYTTGASQSIPGASQPNTGASQSIPGALQPNIGTVQRRCTPLTHPRTLHIGCGMEARVKGQSPQRNTDWAERKAHTSAVARPPAAGFPIQNGRCPMQVHTYLRLQPRLAETLRRAEAQLLGRCSSLSEYQYISIFV